MHLVLVRLNDKSRKLVTTDDEKLIPWIIAHYRVYSSVVSIVIMYADNSQELYFRDKKTKVWRHKLRDIQDSL